MSGTPSPRAADLDVSESMPVWWVALAGLAVMYLPMYWAAAGGLWRSDDHAHGVIVLVVALWLFWTVRQKVAGIHTSPAPAIGWPLFLFGLSLYVVGRAVGITILEFSSQPLVLAGLLLVLKGPRAMKVAWFPIAYLIFMVPLPGVFVDAVTGPLKSWISMIVVEVLHWAGYPIARNGVTITVGQYQMLVADACSGLHSMFSLSALGTLFMYVTDRKGRWHNAAMLAAILPIAFMANIFRVIFLVLITYHFGDEAGQGFLHGAAGLVLMLIALLAFFSLDRVISLLPITSNGALIEK